VDDGDNVYFAGSEAEQTDEIYCGNFADNTWETIKLPSSVSPNDMLVAFSGGIFVNNTGDSSLYNVITGDKAEYKGQLIGIYDGGFLTQENGRVKDNRF
jgi:hypothetical protein